MFKCFVAEDECRMTIMLHPTALKDECGYLPSGAWRYQTVGPLSA